MKKSTFHIGDCLFGMLGVEIIHQNFSYEPWPVWWMGCAAVIIIILWTIGK